MVTFHRNTLVSFVGICNRDWLLGVTICDPACGSGAFLNQALESLIEEHRYLDELESKLLGGGIVFTEVQNSILENNLYGVDVNEEGVEIAKLSLWLRTARIGRKLTTLNDNIKCGNSIIDDPLIAGRKAFSWKEEFPEVFANGGFDIMIGNPPYIPLEMLDEDSKSFFRRAYPQLERKYDTSAVFIIHGLFLLKQSGYLGYITPITWQTGENYRLFRQYIFENHSVNKLINLPFNVFSDAYVDTGILLFDNRSRNRYEIHRYNKKTSISALDNIPFKEVETDLVDSESFKIILDPISSRILDRCKTDDFVPLGEITISTQGLSPSRFKKSDTPSEEFQFPYLEKGQVYSYYMLKEEISYTDMSDKVSLQRFYQAEEKVLIRRLVNRQDRLTVSFTDETLVFKKDVNPFIPVNPEEYTAKYLLSILASKLISYLYINSSSIATKDDFRQTTLAEIRSLPIPKHGNQNRLGQLAENLLKLVNQFNKTRDKFLRRLTDNLSLPRTTKKLFSFYKLNFGEFLFELNKLKRPIPLHKQDEWEEYFTASSEVVSELIGQMDAVEKEIDTIVYQLYGITEDEIEIVENTYQ